MPKNKETETQLVRAIQILRRLQGLERGVLLLDLLHEHRISRSQIRRDLIALEEAGIPIVIVQKEGRFGAPASASSAISLLRSSLAPCLSKRLDLRSKAHI